MLHVLPPVISTVLHAILIILYSIAVAYQASPDTSDPRHPQNGPPWYITMSCSVTQNKSYVGYCQQAKATFACFVAMLGIFVIYFGLSLWSCFPSAAQRTEYEEKRKAKKLRWAHLDEPRSADSDYPIPDTPGLQGGMYPVTPRTLAFNTLGGRRDLPLRNPEKHDTKTSTFALRSPGFLRTPMSLRPMSTNKETLSVSDDAASPDPTSPANAVYFPPPPKESAKKGK